LTPSLSPFLSLFCPSFIYFLSPFSIF
jgi:hypothetical protein